MSRLTCTPDRRAAASGAAVLALLAGPWLSAAPSAGAEDMAGRRDLGAALTRCARPAPLPALGVTPGPSAVRTVAASAVRRDVPARAEALAVTAVLADDLEARDAAGFYRELSRTPGWESLPPTLALHRVLGTPDPFAYEELWPRATAVLGDLAGRPADVVAAAVAPGGGAPRSCAAPSSSRSLPLPHGSAYDVTAARDRRTGDELLLEAACGTPVLAATPGYAAVTRDDPRGGPWVLTVTAGGAATRYTHLQRVLVADGAVVTAGQPVAEVGDLGSVDACALGVASRTAGGAERDATQVVRWLVSGTAPTSPGRPPGPPAGAAGESEVLPSTPLEELVAAVEELTAPVSPRPRRGPGSSDAPGPGAVPEAQPGAATTFRVGSFNVLGSHLTAPGGSKPGFAPGPQRMARGLARIESSGTSVVVLNEFETPAASVVGSDGDWQLHRATPNNRFRDGNTNGNAVAWRTDTWSAVAVDEFTVPWRVTLHMPVVTLQHRSTGARVTVVGVHNPATTARAGNQSGARAVARRTELAQVASLRQADPATPVVIAGDFNERDEVYCDFLDSGLQSSAPGPAGGAGCRAPGHTVDWVFGTPGLTFRGEVVDRSTLGTISDHPLLTAAVVLAPQSR